MKWLSRLLTCGYAILAAAGVAETVQAEQSRCIALEMYIDGNQPQSVAAQRILEAFVADRRGISVTVRDLEGPDAAKYRERLSLVAQHFRFDPAKPPIVYGCNRVIAGRQDAQELTSQLNDMLRVDVYVRSGCPRCAKAKPFLKRLQTTYPGFEVRIRDIVTDAQARSELDQLVQRHRQAATSVPVFHLCDQLIVGFDHETTTGQRIEQILTPWTYSCRVAPKETTSDRSTASSPSRTDGRNPTARVPSGMLHTGAALISFDSPEAEHDDSRSEEIPSLPVPGPEQSLPFPTNPTLPLPGESIPPVDTVDLPLFGRLSASHLGLPLFTIAVGLVDGFNPCAMWVLLFLLSILVNLKDRWKILAVAGVFVAISGLAYFAFMAAWLNVFRWVGLLRPVQIALALTAIAVGAIHIKDFFAFKQGVSLSIPESVKPGIYARVRRIVTAENLLGAVIGASILAVMVNIVELLCTAGLPALYTEILTMQQLPTWQNYAYLGLYNIAYMFDDGLMVALVVITLGHRKMQERHGRVLKLISGTAILLLGFVMLIKPEWLV